MKKEEDLSTNQTNESKLSRRSFIKTLSAIVLGAFVGVKIGRHEQTMIKENYFEIDGVKFYPMYESHDIGPTVELPNATDILFRELDYKSYFIDGKGENGFILSTQYTLEPSLFNLKELSTVTISNSHILVPNLVKMFQKVIDLRIPVALGDIGRVDYLDFSDYSENIDRLTTPKSKEKFYGGLISIIVGSLGNTANRLLEKKLPMKMSRRNFLKFALGTTTTAAFSYGAWRTSRSSRFIDYLTEGDQPPPIKRLLTRIQGLSSNIHPESTLVFMRNVLFALKLKTLANRLKNEKDNPLIAYSVGARHNGLEDLLYLDIDTLIAIFRYINPTYYQKAVEKHGEYVWAIRIIQANEQGVFEAKDMMKIEA